MEMEILPVAAVVALFATAAGALTVGAQDEAPPEQVRMQQAAAVAPPPARVQGRPVPRPTVTATKTPTVPEPAAEAPATVTVTLPPAASPPPDPGPGDSAPEAPPEQIIRQGCDTPWGRTEHRLRGIAC